MFDSLFPSHWSDLQKLMWLKILKGGTASYETIVGNPVSFTAKAAPLRQLSVAFSPVQSGTGDPSPENVRPISGWDGAEVWLTGKNIWSPTDSTDGYYGTNGTFNPATANGEVTSDYIPLPSGVAKLTIGYNDLEAGETGWVGICSFDENKQWISRWGSTTNQNIVTVGIPVANAKYIKVIARTYGHGRGGLMLAFGQSVPYVPYDSNSRSISISFGSTVYSGTVDVVTGVGEMTMASLFCDGDTSPISIATLGDYTRFNVVFASDKKGKGTYPPSISNYLVRKVSFAEQSDHFYCNDEGAVVIIATSLVGTTATTIKAYLSNNPLLIVYELAEPLTIQLTPQEVESLAGDNVLFSDANGDLTVEYRSN